MTFPQIFVILVVAIPLVFVLRDQIRLEVAALSIAAVLGIAQFFGVDVFGEGEEATRAAISGFSQPVIVTLLGLFVIAGTLDKLGVTKWMATRILALGGESERRLITLFTVASAFLSLFMNNVAVGALLLPSAMDASQRSGISPSKLLMPVAYGTLLGGIATFFTTANILLSDLLTTASPAQEPLGILSYTPTGGFMALFGIAFIGIFGKTLLPDRPLRPDQITGQRRTGVELSTAYLLNERLWEATLQQGSSLAGKTLRQASISLRLGVTVVEILRDDTVIVAPGSNHTLRAGDVLLIIGREDRVQQLEREGVFIHEDVRSTLMNQLHRTILELVPLPQTKVMGQTLKQLDFRGRYGYTAVAVWRDGRSYRTDIADFPLRIGDSYVLVGEPENIGALRASSDFLLLEPDRQTQTINPRKVGLALAITAGAIGASIFGFPIYIAMLTGAMLMILTGLTTMEAAYRDISWATLFLIAGMYTASLAMVQTGLAELIGDNVVAIVTPLGPLGLVAGSWIMAALLCQVMGGQVTGLVIGPITIAAALALDTNPQAIAVATAIGSSAAFITPMAHPINLLVMTPGNYTFSDFVKFGWWLMLLSFITLLIAMPLFWEL